MVESSARLYSCFLPMLLFMKKQGLVRSARGTHTSYVAFQYRETARAARMTAGKKGRGGGEGGGSRHRAQGPRTLNVHSNDISVDKCVHNNSPAISSSPSSAGRRRAIGGINRSGSPIFFFMTHPLFIDRVCKLKNAFKRSL